MSKEAQLGLFVIVVLIVFLFFTINMGSHFFSQSERTFHFYFENIGTLETGAPVKQMGLDVGAVSERRIVTIADPEPKNFIVVSIKVNDHAKIAKDSKAIIQTLGMMGEKYLDVSFGNGPPATSEDRLEGVPPFELDRVIQNTAMLSDSLLETVNSFNSIFADPEFASNISVLVENLSVISVNVNNFVGSATAGMNQIMDNLSVASADLRTMIATTEVFIQKSQSLLENNEQKINTTLENTAAITGDIRRDILPEMKTFMTEMKGFSAKLDDSMRRANQMIAKIETVVDKNQIQIDETVTNIKDLSANAKQASLKINDMLHQQEGLVHDLFYDPEFSASTKAAIEEASKTLTTVNTLKDRFTFEAELRYFVDNDRFDRDDSHVRADVGIQYDISEDWYLFVGGNDLGATDDFEAQLGYRIGPFAFHGGVIESEAGAGIEWYPIERLTLGLEGVGLTDSGEERLDLYSRYRMWEQVYLTGGVQDVTDRVFPNAGLAIRF